MRIARQSPEDPLRAQLFGIERLEQHAESLAAAQGVMRRSGRGWRLLQRVEHNGRTLRDAHRVIANAIREERAITPAASASGSSMTGRHITSESSSAEPLALVHVPQGAYRPIAPPSSVIDPPALGGSTCLIDHPQHLRSRRVPLRRLRAPPSGRHDDICRCIGVFDAGDFTRYGSNDGFDVFSHREPLPASANNLEIAYIIYILYYK
jgi:hypothetical protein